MNKATQKSTNSISTDVISARQIFFVLAVGCTVKLFMLPSLLAGGAFRDIWASVLLLLALEGVLFGLFVVAFRRAGHFNIQQMFSARFGAVGGIVAKIIYGALAFYFIIKVTLLLSEQYYFLDQVIYRNFNYFATFIPFLVLGVYMASKGLRAIARSADILFFAIAAGVVAMLTLSVVRVNIINFLPIFASGASNIVKVALDNHIYFGSSLVLFMLLGAFKDKAKPYSTNFGYATLRKEILTDMDSPTEATPVFSERKNDKEKKKQSKRVVKYTGFGLLASGLVVFVFSLLFVNLFGGTGYTQHNAIAQTVKYSLPLQFIGGLSWFPLLLVHLGALFYIAVLFYCAVHSATFVFETRNLSLFAVGVGAVIFIIPLVAGTTFASVYAFYYSLRFVLFGIKVVAPLAVAGVALSFSASRISGSRESASKASASKAGENANKSGENAKTDSEILLGGGS